MKTEIKTFERPAKCDVHGDYTEKGVLILDDRVIWTGCFQCNEITKAEEEAKQKAREEAERQARIEARFESVGIPAAFRGRSFDSFVATTEEQKRALDTAKEFANDFWSVHHPAGRFLVFGGNPGTGKSHLALAIAQQVMQRGTAMYRDVMDVIRMVRSTWSKSSDASENEVFYTLGTVLDLLIIDEIGVQRGTEDEQVILFDILNRRYRDNRPTILLTNLGGKALSEFLGARVMDRLHERSIFVPFKWASHRSNKTWE